MKQTIKKRKRSVLRVLLLLSILLLLFSGCEQPAQNPDGDASSDGVGLEYGFDSGAGCEDSPPFYSAYRSDVNEFDINAVTLEFCYGGYYPLGSE